MGSRDREKLAASQARYRAANPGRSTRWRKANPEKAAANYAANRDKIIVAALQWAKNNPESARRKMADYYVRHRDERCAAGAAWRQENPQKDAARQARRRAALAQRTPHWANLEDISMFYEVAEVLSRGGVDFEVDHGIPLRGKRASGLHVTENLQVLPLYKNREKSNKYEAA